MATATSVREQASRGSTARGGIGSGIGGGIGLLLTAAALAAVVAGVVPNVAQGQESGAVATAPEAAGSALAARGAELFERNCSVCHGATGLGLAEARLAFPADHRRCQRCHRPGNPTVMSLAEIEARQHDLFDVGDPPSLRGDRALAATTAPESLRAYLAATMPRYRPGTLSPAEYDAVTAFLLQLNGRRLP